MLSPESVKQDIPAEGDLSIPQKNGNQQKRSYLESRAGILRHPQRNGGGQESLDVF
jgi:hypothetical protein